MVKTSGIKHMHTVDTGGKQIKGRAPTPDYSMESLMSEMRAYIKRVGVKSALDFQTYRCVRLSGAVQGRGLLQNKHFIQMLIGVSPYLLFKNQDLKASYLVMAAEFDGITGLHTKATDKWSSELSERTMVILNHMRRLKHSETRMRQACGKLDADSVQTLRNLVNQVLPSDELNPVSVTSQALVPRGSQKAGNYDAESSDLNSLMDCEPVLPMKMKKEEVKAKGAKEVVKAISKHHEQSGNKDKHPGGTMSTLRVTYGTKQSYIQYFTAEKKKKLLVAITSSMAKDHKAVCKVMYDHFKGQHEVSKATALSLRAALLG